VLAQAVFQITRRSDVSLVGMGDASKDVHVIYESPPSRACVEFRHPNHGLDNLDNEVRKLRVHLELRRAFAFALP
jgi:hypothetical protein